MSNHAAAARSSPLTRRLFGDAAILQEHLLLPRTSSLDVAANAALRLDQKVPVLEASFALQEVRHDS